MAFSAQHRASSGRLTPRARRWVTVLTIYGGSPPVLKIFALATAMLTLVTMPTAAQDAPLDFKGDQLGMTLDAFRQKHRRLTEGRQYAPFCSDTSPDGAYLGKTVRLAQEVWCMLEYPYEMNNRQYVPPTFAGVAVLNPARNHSVPGLLYRFIEDGGVHKLFSVEAAVSSSDHSTLLEALKVKFGSPSTTLTETLQNLYGAKLDGTVTTWDTPSWRINLIERYSFVDVTAVIYRDKRLESSFITMRGEAIKKAAEDM